jgi:DNA-binding HxlR family transcriptional regulator
MQVTGSALRRYGDAVPARRRPESRPRRRPSGRRSVRDEGAAVDAAGGPRASALARAAEAVGDRWSLLVVAHLLDGPARFGELEAAVDGLAPNILARRLARLEQEGLVVGEPYSTRPVRHTYRLTASGGELAGALRLLAAWGAARSATDTGEAPHHGPCGTALDVRWWCPTCGEPVDDVAASGPARSGGPERPSRGDGLIWL